MQPDTPNVDARTRCSGSIDDAWARMEVLRASAADAQILQDRGPGPSLTVLSQQVSEAVVPPSATACSLAGYGALSHLSGLSSELYLREKQEEIDREDNTCTEP